MISVRHNLACLLIISAGIVFIDQMTKLAVLRHLRLGGSVVVVPDVFQITRRFNNGFAFGTLSNWPGHHVNVFALSSMVAVATILVIALVSLGNRLTMLTVCLALYVGCALGNLSDLFTYGGSVDFLAVSIFGYHWPDFNVADISATVADILLLLYLILGWSRATVELRALGNVFGLDRIRAWLRKRVSPSQFEQML